MNFIALMMGELRQLKEMKKQMKEETVDPNFYIGFILLLYWIYITFILDLYLSTSLARSPSNHHPSIHPSLHSSIHPYIYPSYIFFFTVCLKDHWKFYKKKLQFPDELSLVSYSPSHPNFLGLSLLIRQLRRLP